MATAVIQSNGGEDVEMSVFWGSTDGGKNPGLWENNFTLEGNFTEGRVSHFIDDLDLGSSYYYRWMASNTVSPETWSEPSTDGLVNWWSFDEIEGSKVTDRTGQNDGVLEGISAGERTFAYQRLGSPFTGDPEKVVRISGYKGISGNNARTLSLWINTSQPDSTVIDWGGSGTGNSWTLVIKDGKPGLLADQNLMLISEDLIHDSNWHHLVLSFPAGSQKLSDVSIYVDGEPSETSIAFNLDPSTYGPSLWLDGTDIDGDGMTDSSSSGPISSWNDISGNSLNATQSNSTNRPTLIPSELNGKPVVSFDGTNDYLSSTGLNITQPYSIFLVANTTNNTSGRDNLFDGLLINTSADRDVTIGGYLSGGNFSGTLDEIKIYERGLTSADVRTLFLDGTVKFTTTTTRQPPVVELYDALPDSNDSVVLLGELTNVDQENPIVTIYYGSKDGGLSPENWEHNITVNDGEPLNAGQFQATIEGLNSWSTLLLSCLC